MKYWMKMVSPIGGLLLVAENGALREVGFVNGRRPAMPPADARKDRAPFSAAIEQLEEYFAGIRRVFDLPLAPLGTAFQQRVWNALLKVEYGRTASYGDVARAIGNANAVRAVGLANGRNPIPVIIPCHRVIGSNGTLTGYGGGLDIKKRLLDLEGAAYKQ